MEPEADAAAAVDNLLRALTDRLRARDVESVLSLFDRGAVVFGSEIGESATGQAELRLFFSRIFARPRTYGWMWDPLAVRSTSDVVWLRRVGVLWWSLGLVGVDALLAVAYATIRDNNELDRTFGDLPPSVRAMLALQHGSTLTSPIGYFNSQFLANVLPVMLLTFGIGLAAWSIAGDEAAGTLELLLSGPISRLGVALQRAGAVVALLTVLVAVAAAGMVALAHPFGLDRGLNSGSIVAGVAAAGFLALAYSAVAFAVGAASGSRPAAIASAAAIAVAQFMIEGLAEPVKALQPLRELSPWHWMLGSNPLANGLTWRTWALPLAVGAALLALGTWRFTRRDLG